MGFDEGHFVLDHVNLTYHTGQIVSGKLVFDQTEFKTFIGLYVRLKGQCNIHWTTRHSRLLNDRTEHYDVNHNAHEVYVESQVYLMGGTEGKVHLQPGHYELPFQFMIPANCPSSFEGANGNIRYTIKAVVDRAFKFDQEKVANLTVINQRDLNREPYCREPMRFDFEQTYCCWCMSSGLFEVTVLLPQSGYCPGQTVRIEVNCANKSYVLIDELKFEIIEYRKFRATCEPDTRKENHVVAKLKKGPVRPNTTRNLTLEMEIPAMDLYNVDTCEYIDIHHEFKVVVSPSGCHTDSDESRRIVLGHIPLRESDAPPHSDHIVEQPVAPKMAQYPNYPNQQYPGANLPNVQPLTGANPTPYPGANLTSLNLTPYPGVSPYPNANPPYPNVQLPGVSPYPVGPMQMGFAIPNSEPPTDQLLPGAGIPYPPNPPIVLSPYAFATAPEPGTPDVPKIGFDLKKLRCEKITGAGSGGTP